MSVSVGHVSFLLFFAEKQRRVYIHNVPVCTFKTLPRVPSKRSRMYIHNVPVCTFKTLPRVPSKRPTCRKGETCFFSLHKIERLRQTGSAHRGLSPTDRPTLIQWCRIDVDPNSFCDRNIIGRQIYNRLWSWLSLCKKSPCAYEQLNVLNGNFF